MMKGPKGQRGSAKSPIQMMRSKSPAESSESIINSSVRSGCPHFGVKTLSEEGHHSRCEQLLGFYGRM